jgi:glucosamine 6-phosphate synthetase-like amidotransferase/phosphosugar isomerase protein
MKIDTRLIEKLANVQTIVIENVSDTRFLNILDTKLRQIKSRGYKIILLTDLNQDQFDAIQKVTSMISSQEQNLQTLCEYWMRCCKLRVRER